MIFSFKTEEEAIRLANGTEFGLGAPVWSRDPERANRLASRIEAGMVFINDIVHSDPRAPFGGVKASGFGRELGASGALELTNPKLIWHDLRSERPRISSPKAASTVVGGDASRQFPTEEPQGAR
jgi:succinate-semialdehyde dehydrogenase/glutarate-semialdehyde dehydrogenase/succinate-semialdehyde dehydrogenase